MDNKDRISDGLPTKIIKMVLPMAFGQFMLALMGASDAFMLGQLSQNSMSAVSLASQVTFVFNLFMAAFLIGENMFVAQVYLALMKNCGAVNLSTAISSVMVLLNILLNAVFIFGLFGMPAMGVKGAAIATVIATFVQTFRSVIYVFLKMGKVRESTILWNCFCDRELMKRFWSKTATVLCNELIWCGALPYH